MKEIIEITEKNGKKKKAEVIIRLQSKDDNTYYIIYKCNNEYYAAKYDDVIGTSKLNTDLTNEELNYLETILNKVLEE